MGSPKAPAPLPDRQAAQAPSIDASINRSNARQLTRAGFAGLRLTPNAGLGSAATTGKSLLGS